MPSPEHEYYLENVSTSLRRLALIPELMLEIRYRQDTLLLLSVVDLGPALPILDRCYSDVPRGSKRADPLAILRLLLLGACIGVMKLNALVRLLRHSPVLATLVGFPPDASGESTVPSISTVYEFLHRLHDGPTRRIRGTVRPSVTEFRATKAEMTPSVRHHGEEEADDTPASEAPDVIKAARKEAKKEARKEAKKEAKTGKKKSSRTTYRNRARDDKKVTEALRVALVKQDGGSLPDDLPTRLLEILHAVAVRPSAEAGLMGDKGALQLAGDGSALVTNSEGHGKKVDTCPHGRWAHCDCPRIWSDPDAARGWDHYRNMHFFGYFYYEIVSVGGKSELPVFIGLNPANTNDAPAAMKAISTLTRFLHRPEVGYGVDVFIGDCGHDGEPFHQYLYMDLGIKPVIPLSGDAPAVHPLRAEVKLDPKTGVPLCEAGCPMASWGTAGEGRSNFICPVKAGKIEKCPLAPEDKPDHSCREGMTFGPTTTLNAADNPRLAPVIARNSKKYEVLYNKRSACERANSFNKETRHLESCGHRRCHSGSSDSTRWPFSSTGKPGSQIQMPRST